MNVECDKSGYLKDINSWNNDVYQQFAKELSITLTPLHALIVQFAREYYLEYEIAPTLRVIITHVKTHPTTADSSFNSILLNEMFQGQPALNISKLAGLPKPTRCT